MLLCRNSTDATAKNRGLMSSRVRNFIILHSFTIGGRVYPVPVPSLQRLNHLIIYDEIRYHIMPLEDNPKRAHYTFLQSAITTWRTRKIVWLEKQ